MDEAEPRTAPAEGAPNPAPRSGSAGPAPTGGTRASRERGIALAGPDGHLARRLDEAERLLPAAVAADEEAIHDLRVCLRRVRVLSAELPAGAGSRGPLAELRAGATRLFRALAGVRDLDILRRELVSAARAGLLPGAPDPEIAAWLELERRRLRVGLPAAAEVFRASSARFRSTAATLPPGTGAPGSAARPYGPGLPPPAVAPPPARLRRAARRLLRQLGRVRGAPSDTALHRLRILGKQLRYAAEACPGGVAAAAPGGVLESGLKRLQDALGTLQDAAMAMARLEALATGGTLSPAAAGPARAVLANERERRRREFLEALSAGVYTDLLDEVRNVAANQVDGAEGAFHVPEGASLKAIPGIGAAKARRLAEAGLGTPDALKAASLEDLTSVKTIGPHQARLIKEYVESAGDGSRPPSTGEGPPDGKREGEPDGKRFERVQSVVALAAVVSDYAGTLAEDLSRLEEGDAARAGRQAERLADVLAELPARVQAITTRKLKSLRGELRETEGLLAKVLELDAAGLKMNRLRKALKAHRRAVEGYLA